MRKYLIIITILIFLPIFYLSIIGIETESFNEKIKGKVKESNKNLKLNIKKIKLKLDPLRLKFNAKTEGVSKVRNKKKVKIINP